MALILAWYFHLPPCASVQEVEALVDDSLALLLEAHGDTGSKVGIAVTGSLLERIAQVGRGDCLRLFADLAARGVVEPFATTAYEVCPFLIPPRYLYRQIEHDLAIKARLLGVRPFAFWPGNLAWTPVLPRILAALGLRAAIVDEAHLRAARETQLWTWLNKDPLRLDTTLVDTMLADPAQHRSYRLDLDEGGAIALLVQAAALRRQLSFGTSGVIHHAWDHAGLDAVAAALNRTAESEDGATQFSGDDGDRINPVSIYQYRRLIAQIAPALRSTTALTMAGAEPLDFLPVHAPGGTAFWQDGVALGYHQLLEELYRRVDQGAVAFDDVLPLQDVFPVFWKRIARARWFYDRAWALARG